MKTRSALLCCLLVGGGPTWAARVVRGPFLQAVGSNRATVCWRTDVETDSRLAYGPDADGPMLVESLSGSRTDHAVTVTGLTPGSRYFYGVQGTPAAGEPVSVSGDDQWFRTAPAQGQETPIRLWVVGDSGYNFPAPLGCYQNYLAATAGAGKSTTAFLMLGDNAYDLGTDAEIQAAVFNRYAALLRNTPVWSAFGNHDGFTVPYPYTAVTPYDQAFRFPTMGQCGGVPSGTGRYYSFDHGNIHFICLDTNTPVNANDGPGGSYGMVDWLKDDLQACSADWIIAYMHQCPYTKGSHNSDLEGDLIQIRKFIVPLLESYGADLVLTAHSHVYERSGLIDGHYGTSTTWNPTTMSKWPGNGSDLGGVSPSGSFVTSAGSAGGAYQKPAATGRAGTVYVVLGSSSWTYGWYGGSTALVCPTPHPIHRVSLNLPGSLVVEINGTRLNGRYFDQTGSVRDDFSIIKGERYELLPPQPAFPDPATPRLSFGIRREGAIAFSGQVGFQAESPAGGAVQPGSGTVPMAAGSGESAVVCSPGVSGIGVNFQMRLTGATRPVQEGAAERAVYRVVGSGIMPGSIQSTPSGSWYCSRFGGLPVSPGDWKLDEDGDGMSRLMEYATGSEPGRFERTAAGAIESGNLVFRYWRGTGASDVELEAMISHDAREWLPAGSFDLSDGPASLRGEPRKLVVPVGGQRGLVRLRAVLSE